MKRSIIWTTAGIAAIGFAVPAFASNGSTTKPTTPAQVNVTVPTTATTNVAQNSGIDSARDIVEATAITSSSIDDDATSTSIDDGDATTNSIDDDATTSNLEDVSGNCDEAEHANDDACTGAVQDDNSSDDNSSQSSDDSGHSSDDSGHGSDDSGHGSDDD